MVEICGCNPKVGRSGVHGLLKGRVALKDLKPFREAKSGSLVVCENKKTFKPGTAGVVHRFIHRVCLRNNDPKLCKP